MSGMRVLAVTPWFPCEAAPGSGLFNLRDVRLLTQDHEVEVLHLIRPEWFRGNEVDLSGLRVTRIPFSIRRPNTLHSAARSIRERAIDFEIVHSMAFSALPPMRRAKIAVPWVHTEHYSQLVTPSLSKPMAAINEVLKRLFAFPTETVAVSRALANVIDRYRSVPTTVIGNEVMIPTDPIPQSGLNPGRVQLIGVGGIIERKGSIPAVETMVELRRRGIDASLTWVGEGDLAARMGTVAAEAGMAVHLRLTGQLAPEELSQELLGADLFLLPVETETFGVAIAEALAHGLPVVATGTGGHEEFLPPEASRLIGERAAGPLADAVQDLLGDRDVWSRTETAAYARERFSTQTRRTQYLDVYARAAEAHAG